MTAILDLGQHAGFIWASYGATLILLGGLIAWIRADARHQLRLLDELEAQGVQRRSTRGAPPQGERGKGKAAR